MVYADTVNDFLDSSARITLMDRTVSVVTGDRKRGFSVDAFEQHARRLWASVQEIDLSIRHISGSVVPGAPTRLGRWALIRPLGRGAFCDVWLGLDLTTGAERAVKIVHTGESSDRRDLREEARTLFRTPVEGVISPMGLYRDLGHDFMVMEYVAGRHLLDACEGLGREERRVLVDSILPSLTRVVEQLHANGLVHGDIKPTNIMLRTDGSVVLIDFGFSTRMAQVGTTDSHGFTPIYAAPELLQGGNVSAETDWFALGASLYEAFHGMPPHAERGGSWLQDRGQAAEICWFGDESETTERLRILLSVSPTRRSTEANIAGDPVALLGRGRLVGDLQNLLADGVGVQVVIGVPGSGKSAVLKALHRALLEAGAYVMEARLNAGDHLPFRSVEHLRSGLLERSAAPEGGSDMSFLGSSDWMQPGAGLALARLTDGVVSASMVVYLLDDAHWGDVDGAVMIAEWASSSPGARVVLTTADVKSAFVLAFLRHSRGQASHHHIGVSSDADSAELPPTFRPDDAYLEEVVSLPRGLRGSLAKATEATLHALPRHYRHFLEYLAVSAQPMSSSVTSQIALLVGVDHQLARAYLTRSRMLREQVVDSHSMLSLYDASFETQLLQGLTSESIDRMHERLLAMNDAAGLGPHANYPHLVALGRTEEAFACCIASADNAHRSNARLQQLIWLQRGLSHCEGSLLDALRVRTANAAMAVGHTELAAELWVSVREGSIGDVGLARRATAAWLLAGDYDRALAASHDELCGLGASPNRRGLALAVSVVPRLLRALIMSVPQQRDGAATHSDADFLWTVGTGLAFVRSVLGLDYVLRALALYRRAGSASGVGRCLAFLGGSVFLHLPMFRRLGARWLEQAGTRANLHGEESLLVSVELWKGFHAIGFGDFDSAKGHIRRTMIASHRLPGLVWERVVAAGLKAWLLQFEGSFLELRAFCNEHYIDAVRRGDQYARHLFVQYLTYTDICAGQSTAAIQTARELASIWPAEGYSVLAFYGMYLEVMALLYNGDAQGASERWERDQASFRKAGLHMIPASRIDNLLLEARIKVRGADAKAQAARLAGRMRKHMRPDTLGYAAWLDVVAGVASLDALGDILGELGMRTLALTARWYESPTPEAQDALVRRGIASPEVWVAAFLPMPV